jgi:hypothetical protein
MKFKLPSPEDRKKLSADELNELLDAAIAEYTELSTIPDDKITDEELADLESIGDAVNTVNAEVVEREAEGTARAERIAAAKAKVTVSDSDATEGDEGGEGDEGDEGDKEGEQEAVEQDKEPVLASARSVVRSAASRRRVDTRPVLTQEDEKPKGLAITAAADVPNFSSGQALADWDELTHAFMERSKSFRNRNDRNSGLMRYGAVKLAKPENDFTITKGMTAEQQFALIDQAADEKRLPQGGLVAAGGWCAPSETLYDFYSLEQVDGILSIPEFQVKHGGINFTTGPSYSDLTADANFGFLQTEAQAEAGDAKTCFQIDCPDWEDVRMDAIGFCIKAGILTEAQFPELIRRFLQMGATAHAHKMNAQVISRIATALGTAVDYTEQGSGSADLLNAIELNAEVIRYQFSMKIGATIEVVLPAWARLIFRQDLALRVGAEGSYSITDAQIAQWFSVRGLAVQWVYDYQSTAIAPASNSGKAMPTSVDVLMYPAGTFVKGTAPVIDLDTVYDSTGLNTNNYTAAFFEEGLLVAQRGIAGRKLTVALNYKGASGFPSVGAGSGVTFAAA